MFVCIKEMIYLLKNYAGLLQCNYFNPAIIENKRWQHFCKQTNNIEEYK